MEFRKGAFDFQTSQQNQKIHIEDTHVRLESLNKDTYDNGELIYPDILLENTENLRLIGKVIDSFKPIEIK